jgi:hypothetical protein
VKCWSGWEELPICTMTRRALGAARRAADSSRRGTKPSPHQSLLHHRPRRPILRRMTEKPTTDEIKALRSAATARVESTSLRATAREIHMSPSGLQKFLRGAEPYGPTILRLRAWYGDDATERAQDEAIAALLAFMPAQRRTAAEAAMRVMLAGPVRQRLALDGALAEIEDAKDRIALARALSQLATRETGRPTACHRDLRVEDVTILGALVDLLDAELPGDALLRVNGRRIGRAALLDGLRRYVNSPPA